MRSPTRSSTKPPRTPSTKDMARHAGEAASMLKALAHRARLLVLCQLVEGERSVGDLQPLTDSSGNVLACDDAGSNSCFDAPDLSDSFLALEDGNLSGWPKPVGSGSDPTSYRTGSGGETSTRMYDLDGENTLEVLTATSSGELHALRPDGTPLPSFNGGQPVRTRPYALAEEHPTLSVVGAGPPRESLRIPG